jgi:hypothetical protein
MPERKRDIPEWARRERLADLAWIIENLPGFWVAAQRGFSEFGRGAVTVDTTIQPEPGKGNPIWYVPQELINQHFSEDEQRLVSRYQPDAELVTILLKPDARVSTYRVQARPTTEALLAEVAEKIKVAREKKAELDELAQLFRDQSILEAKVRMHRLRHWAEQVEAKGGTVEAAAYRADAARIHTILAQLGEHTEEVEEGDHPDNS